MIPNAFSPNDDGLNDKFNGHPEQYILRIFNRWRENVFTSYKVSDKWDGTFGGKICETGTYFYQLQSKCFNGEIEVQKGEITLIR